MLLVAKNIISDSNLFFYLYNFSQSTTFEYNSVYIPFPAGCMFTHLNDLCTVIPGLSVFTAYAKRQNNKLNVCFVNKAFDKMNMCKYNYDDLVD